MTPVTISAVLLIITAILHMATLVQFGRDSTTIPVAVYGVIYGILGGLLLAETFSWTALGAFILTLIGAIAAITQINNAPAMRSWMVGFIGIDIAILGLLGVHLFL